MKKNLPMCKENDDFEPNKKFFNYWGSKNHINFLLDTYTSGEQQIEEKNLYNSFFNDFQNLEPYNKFLIECNELNYPNLIECEEFYEIKKSFLEGHDRNDSFFKGHSEDNLRESFLKRHHKHHHPGEECFNNDDFENFDKRFGNLIFRKFISKGFLNIIILWIISKEKIHGYGIMKYLDKFFGEFIEKGFISKFNSSKIYPMLKGLERKEFIIGEWDINDNKKVKYYTITPIGEKFLENIQNKSHKVVGNDLWREFFNDLGFEVSFKERGE